MTTAQPQMSSGAPATPELQVGHRVGRYRFGNRIGVGTTATVWRVESVDTGPPIAHAAKVFIGPQEAIHGARIEAARLIQIDSKHVVDLHDVREFLVLDHHSWLMLGSPVTADEVTAALRPWAERSPADADQRVLVDYATDVVSQSLDVPEPPVVVQQPGFGGAILVQTLCKQTLEQHWLDAGRTLPEVDAVEIVVQVAEALRSVHAAPGNRPHLDVKLDNVFQQDDANSWLLGDLGLGSAISRIGTGDRVPWYLALPDFRAHRVSDIWLAGLMLHQLATGLLPITFSGIPLMSIPPNFYYVARELTRNNADRAEGSGIWIHPAVTESLRKVIADCLQADYRLRPSADQLVTRLRSLQDLNPNARRVGRHLQSGQGVMVAAADAAWVLGYDSVDEMAAAGLPIRSGQVDASEFLAAVPAELPEVVRPAATVSRGPAAATTAPGHTATTTPRPYRGPVKKTPVFAPPATAEPEPTSRRGRTLASVALGLIVVAAGFLGLQALGSANAGGDDGRTEAGEQRLASAAAGSEARSPADGQPGQETTAPSGSPTGVQTDDAAANATPPTDLDHRWLPDGSVAVTWSAGSVPVDHAVYLGKSLVEVVPAGTSEVVLGPERTDTGLNYLLELGAVGAEPLDRVVAVITAPGVDPFASDSTMDPAPSASATSTTANITWDPVDGGSNYVVFLDRQVIGGTEPGGPTGYRIDGLNPGEHYLVEVRTNVVGSADSRKVPLVVTTEDGGG